MAENALAEGHLIAYAGSMWFRESRVPPAEPPPPPPSPSFPAIFCSISNCSGRKRKRSLSAGC